MITEAKSPRTRNSISSEIGKELFIVKQKLKNVNDDLQKNLQSRQNCNGNYELSMELVKEKKKLVERRNGLTKRLGQLKFLMRVSEKAFRTSLFIP